MEEKMLKELKIGEVRKVQPKEDAKTEQKVEQKTLDSQTKKTFWDKMDLWQKILIIVVLGLATLCTIALGTWIYVFQRPVSPAKVLDFNQSYSAPVYDSSMMAVLKKFVINIANPDQPRTEVSPLNGLLFTKDEMATMMKRRPVAVMINNHFQARPQSNLSKADVIYEAVTESGITRYMAVFWSNTPNKVGSIRSARQYYLEWLSEYDPIFIHDGCAQTNDPRTNACGNIYTYGIKDIRTIGAWRVNTNVAPHNEYTSAAYAVEYAKKLKWGGFQDDVDALKFKKQANLEDRGDKTRVKIRFREDLANDGTYDAEWTYDKNTNSYLRKIGGSADMDAETKKQIAAKVVIVQEVAMLDANDGKGRVIITTIGDGKAVILQDGKIIKGTWKKKSRTDRTNFYDSSGKEIELNRGLLWISAMSKEKGQFDILAQ